MAADRASASIYRFLRFGPSWPPELLRRFVELVSSWLSGSPGSEGGAGIIPEDLEALLRILRDKPYPEAAAMAEGLGERFRDGILDATAAASEAIQREDPSRELEEELRGVDCSDEKALGKVLHSVSELVGYSSKLGYFIEELQDPKREGGKGGRLDRAALVDRACETAQGAIDSYRREFSRRFIDARFEDYLASLDAKYAALRLLRSRLSTFVRWFGRFWDLSDGRWEASAWASLAEYAERLERSPGLQELLASLGRMAEAERELRIEESAAASAKPEWRPGGIGKSEISGIRFSDDLASMLPSEAALLAFPETELLFLKKYAEKGLLTLEYSGEELFEKPEPRTVQEESTAVRRGPFIVCVDTSGSMHGAPETIAKTLALALLKQALEQSRPCLLVSFSTSVAVLDLTAVGKGLDALIDFLSMSFHGGTDAAAPLEYCLARLAEKEWKRADVLVVSDLVAPRPADEVCESLREARENGSRFNALIIGQNAHSGLEELFDRSWLYDPERGVYRDLARVAARL